MDEYDLIINEYETALEAFDKCFLASEVEFAMEASNSKETTPSEDTGGEPLDKDITINPTASMKTNGKDMNNDDINGKNGGVNPKSIKDRLDVLVKKIWGIVVKLSDSFLNLIKRALVTNKKFDGMYRSYKGKYKPATMIKVIIYPYERIGLLEKINNNFVNTIKIMCRDYRAALSSENDLEKSLIVLNKDDLQKEIMRIMDAPSNVESIADNYVVLKNKIRGKKTEATVTVGDISKYEKAFYSAMDYTSEANKRLKNCKDSIFTIKQANTVIGAMTNKNVSDLYSKASKFLSNINIMYSAYVAYCKTEFLLRSEYAFTGRAILKRMYRMP